MEKFNNVRIIDANPLKELLMHEFKQSGEYTMYEVGIGEALNYLDDQPTIDPESLRPHGKWETDKEDIEWGNHLKKKHCTNCGSRPHYDKEKGIFILTAYCHNCGATMEGTANENQSN